jgi:hypothetical protein
MLLIVEPVPIVLSTVHVDIDTSPIGLVFFPEPVEDIPVSMPKLPSTMGFVILPSALVLCAIRPDLHSVTVTVVFLPLTLVDCTVIKYIFFFEENLRIFLFVKFFFFKYCLIISF